MLTKRLLLVDYENVHKIDLSLLDESYSAIIYVGAQQSLPKAASRAKTAHRFSRVDFQKIEGVGKNALDFHIAFQLGRVIETAPCTECFVLSRDKGFDPLLAHLNKNGLRCSRVPSIEDLLPKHQERAQGPEDVVCRRCRKASTIEHHGGRWCTNCGCFASPPDAKLLPSCQPGFVASADMHPYRHRRHTEHTTQCGWCHQRCDMSGGIYDDGEWMCGGCISRYGQ